jgi:putative membrane protein
MRQSEERKEWLQRKPEDAKAKKLTNAAWVVTALVLVLVGLMRSPYKIPLPDGWSMSYLPPAHAIINTLVSICLIGAVITVKQGKISAHRSFIMAAMALSTLFLLCYVAYHFTTVETRYGGEGAMRVAYFFLLITHIVLAAVSLPMILLTFISAWTNRFEQHRRMARWVFPIWLYVAVTGPICYLMLRPFYP